MDRSATQYLTMAICTVAVWVACLACLLCARSVLADDADLRQLEKRVDAATADNKPAEAIDILNEALKQKPDWREGWWRLGNLLYQADKYAQAGPAFERLANLDPKQGAPWVLLGLCEFEARDYGVALQHLVRGQALGFSSKLELVEVARYHEALALIITEKFEQAQILLQNLVQKQPS